LQAQEADEATEATTESSETTAPSDTTDVNPEALHDELRAVRDKIVEAVNQQNINSLLSHLHPDVVVVWQDGVTSRGHDGVRKYYNDNLGGPDAVLESYTVEPQIDELTLLHGDDTGVSFGRILCHFKFKSGREFDLDGPFSATLVRQNGEWKIAGFHASAGLFDNPLLMATKQMLVIGCIAAAAIGLVVGAAVVAIFKRRKRA
jgi:ketosteroid isomerase-like protein